MQDENVNNARNKAKLGEKEQVVIQINISYNNEKSVIHLDQNAKKL